MRLLPAEVIAGMATSRSACASNDPIITAIKANARAFDVCESADLDFDTEQGKKLFDEFIEALIAALSTVPTTLQGVLTLLRYVEGHRGRGDCNILRIGIDDDFKGGNMRAAHLHADQGARCDRRADRGCGMKRASRKAKPPAARPLSRNTLNRLLKDIAERIDERMYETEAVMETIQPNGEHIVAEARVRTAVYLMLSDRISKMQQIRRLMKTACR